jgi:diguanylate cyclase (GGDEF)-like protein
LLNENKDYQQAYEYMRKAERALLAKARLDITNETARLSVQFKLRQQQLENIYTERQKSALEERNFLLQSKVSLQQKIYDTQSWIVVGLSVLVVVFLGLILIIYRLYYKTKILASRDGLTGLSNRRSIISQAEHEYAVSLRYGHGLSIIMLDIDRFKSINDQFGHAEGDKTLKAIAKILRSMLRESDHLGRIGGEEFLFVLPHTDEVEALQFAERIRKNIKHQLAEKNHQIKDVTVSLGVASSSSDTVTKDSSIQQIIAQADQALYLAKNRGRDQVQILSVEQNLKMPEMQLPNQGV